MEELKVKDFVEVTGAEVLCGSLDEVLGEFKKDTREINIGDTYVGIKGEKIDGSLLFEKAFECGAKVCIVQDIEISPELIQRFSRKGNFEDPKFYLCTSRVCKV